MAESSLALYWPQGLGADHTAGSEIG